MLPAEAHAKITCRIVPDQDPERIPALIAAHVEKHTPSGVRATVAPMFDGARAYVIPDSHPGNRVAGEVLQEVYGRAPYHTRMGGSVPVLDLFYRELGAHTVTFSFGLPDEQTHSPNEFFRLSSFQRAQRAYCMLFQRLAEQASLNS